MIEGAREGEDCYEAGVNGWVRVQRIVVCCLGSLVLFEISSVDFLLFLLGVSAICCFLFLLRDLLYQLSSISAARPLPPVSL